MLHEGTARRAYMKAAQQEHEGLTVEKSGLIVNPDFPFVGASPDGIVSCACCGARSVCLEIKCPFKHKSVTIREACSDKHFCLEVIDTCIIRIDADEAFWSQCLEKASVFFEKVCLPELVGRHFTCGGKKPAADTKTGKSSHRKPLCPSPQKGSTAASSSKRASSVSPSKQRQRKRQSKKLWCSCRKTEDYDNMVACENENCEVQWYHLSCVGLNHTPEADEVWFCPTCSQGGY
ncbi:hypothetical protein BaRGS_00008874 [Batillaria attramentaria]|uniref:PHD-type domain-containing protein n=1 Tax=Batillaria attramentaria TaxID=370345 RepID=A0ABD0LKU8_9CAEN